MIKIGNVPIDPPLILAPMSGITDRQFRLVLHRLGGVGLLTMEFISSEGLLRGNRHSRERLRYSKEEHPLAVQIHGSDPDRMAEAASMVQESGADICDINMGCPANKIRKTGSGCALMGDLELAGRIISRVRRAITIPLTVKFRAGLTDNRLNYLELGRTCQDRGADAVTLHPRTARQMFSGKADWSRIEKLKNELRIPVIGNGDVLVAGDAVRMFRETGCDAVMIGRASMKNPWIYRQAAGLLAGTEPVEPTLRERRDLILAHFEMLRRQEEGRLVLHKMRTFTGWYTRGLPGGRNLRIRIGTLETPEQFVEALESFFADAGLA